MFKHYNEHVLCYQPHKSPRRQFLIRRLGRPETDPTNGNSKSDTQVTPCDGTANSTTWCCGNSTSCCGTSDAVTIAPTLSGYTSSTTSSSTSSATVSPTTTASASSLPSATSGLSAGAKAGIGVGVAVGAIAIIFAAFLFWRRRAAYRGLQNNSGPALPLSKTGSVKEPQEADSNVYHEMDTRAPIFELPGEPVTAPKP
ncbi:hypothetical protein UA08_01719 [Talaromyces atroroseus]|uniref:Mid2 domain-containing protein n=1 Tax=Talaromyces atroroseus TaxID=1441469 RepID=A0A1Q5QBN3_TALAT|nr:hypothetical protein UA08_01719 [Talaromyces atroroseus]OKL63291.1 hypothetical protein UA08_01719 [Talaromyces atroroseus]